MGIFRLASGGRIGILAGTGIRYVSNRLFINTIRIIVNDRRVLTKYNDPRLVDRLAEEGLLTRVEREDDGRGATVLVADWGKDPLKSMSGTYGAAI